MVARLLAERGFDVSVFVFQPNDFSAGDLHTHGIPVSALKPRGIVNLVMLMRRALGRSRFDVAVAFLKWSSLVVELAGSLGRDYGIVVSERSLDESGSSIVRFLRYCAHWLADAVVCNSHSQHKQLCRTVPWLCRRTSVIVNGVDFTRFRFSPKTDGVSRSRIRMLVLARYAAQKNPFTLLRAVAVLRKRMPKLTLIVDWYGHMPNSDERQEGRLSRHHRSELAAREIYRRMQTEIASESLQDRVRLHGVRKDVVSLYRSCDVVCLPSFYEGCSNVIAEALSCGIPVLASDVSDNGRLVIDEVTGFLFDPHRPSEIANAVRRYSELSASELEAMSRAGRRRAERLLAPTVLGDRFSEIIRDVVDRRTGARGGRRRMSKGIRNRSGRSGSI